MKSLIFIMVLMFSAFSFAQDLKPISETKQRPALEESRFRKDVEKVFEEYRFEKNELSEVSEVGLVRPFSKYRTTRIESISLLNSFGDYDSDEYVGISFRNQEIVTKAKREANGDVSTTRYHFNGDFRGGYSDFDRMDGSTGKHFFGAAQGSANMAYRPRKNSPLFYGGNVTGRFGANFIDERGGRNDASVQGLIQGSGEIGIMKEFSESAETHDYISLGLCTDVRGAYFEEEGFEVDQFVGLSARYVCELGPDSSTDFLTARVKVMEALNDDLRETLIDAKLSYTVDNMQFCVGFTNDSEWFGHMGDENLVYLSFGYVLCNRQK